MDNQSIVWERCLSVIRDNVPTETFASLFSHTQLVSIQEQAVTIKVSSPFIYEFIEENYSDLLIRVLRKEVGIDAKLLYTYDIADNSSTLPSNYTQVPENRPTSIYYNGQQKFDPFIVPGLSSVQIKSNLNPNYAFDNLIEGDCNRLAVTVGKTIAERPGETAFNPLFIYGASGLGKTHIGQAIGIQTKKYHPNKSVLYVSAHVFQNQYISAVRSGDLNSFLHYYQMVDVLILDDVQEFAGQKKTQETFFHIFNHLHQKSKQLIMTSDRAPVDMEGFEPRMLSRMKWGLTADVKIPDYETRKAILRQKSHKDGLDIPENVLDYLANKIDTNIRELEGALVSLVAQTINKRTITLDLAAEIAQKLVKHSKREITVDYIIQTVCEHFKVTPTAMQSATRKREVVQVRQIAMYLCKHMTNCSLSTIGAQTGGKNHATVLHACKTVTNLMETDRNFRDTVASLEKKFAQ